MTPLDVEVDITNQIFSNYNNSPAAETDLNEINLIKKI